jgi:TIR domain
MADIFLSYTSSDRDWTFWIGRELEAIGHVPHVDDWEIKGSDDTYVWMEHTRPCALRDLGRLSEGHRTRTLERHAAMWRAAKKRPGFVLLVGNEALQAAYVEI